MAAKRKALSLMIIIYSHIAPVRSAMIMKKALVVSSLSSAFPCQAQSQLRCGVHQLCTARTKRAAAFDYNQEEESSCGGDPMELNDMIESRAMAESLERPSFSALGRRAIGAVTPADAEGQCSSFFPGGSKCLFIKRSQI